MSRTLYLKSKQLYPTQVLPIPEQIFTRLLPVNTSTSSPPWVPTTQIVANMNEQNLTPVEKELQPTTMNVQYKMLPHANPGDPSVWGPAFWFSLHNGAARYPKNAAPLWRSRMKHFIQGIPVMVPCEACADHATAYIESRRDLDDVVNNRNRLFEFFVNFHNFVNTRLGKATMTMDQARQMYQGTANVLTVKFEAV